MEPATRLTESLVEFARTLTGRFDISDVLNDLALRLPDVLDISGAGVSLLSGAGLSFVTANSQSTASLERVQEELNSGPCVDSIASGEDVLIRDIGEHAQRWPEYAAAAAREGIVAVAALPLRNSIKLGALDLYDSRAREWTPEVVTTARDGVPPERVGTGPRAPHGRAVGAGAEESDRHRAGQGHPRQRERHQRGRRVPAPPQVRPGPQGEPAGGRRGCGVVGASLLILRLPSGGVLEACSVVPVSSEVH